MNKRGVLCLLLVSLVGSAPAVAGNPNEATGFPTHAIMLDGPGGDSISAYNGSLEFSIPIGPTWELPGMSWGLSLHYSSKIWRIQAGRPNDGTLARRGPFGLGWLLTMGRIFYPCREGCPGPTERAYEDPSGTIHPIHFDQGSLSGNVMPGMTTDGTWMRAQPTGGALYFHSGPISSVNPWFQRQLNAGRITQTFPIPGLFTFYK